MSSSEWRSKRRNVRGLPKRVCYKLDSRTASAPMDTTQLNVLSSRCSEIGGGHSGLNALPIRWREINRSGRIQRQARQVQSQAPVQDAVIGEVAEVSQTVRARGTADIGVIRSN